MVPVPIWASICGWRHFLHLKSKISPLLQMYRHYQSIQKFHFVPEYCQICYQFSLEVSWFFLIKDPAETCLRRRRSSESSVSLLISSTAKPTKRFSRRIWRQIQNRKKTQWAIRSGYSTFKGVSFISGVVVSRLKQHCFMADTIFPVRGEKQAIKVEFACHHCQYFTENTD